MKKLVSMLTALVLMCSMLLTPALAYENSESTSEYLGNGITVVRTVTVFDSLLRDSTKKAAVSMEYSNRGELIGTVTLTVKFGYDGSRAWVVSASGSHSIESGWTYRNEDITNSGGTSTLTADIKSTTGLGVVPVDMSLTCTEDGDIS